VTCVTRGAICGKLDNLKCSLSPARGGATPKKKSLADAEADTFPFPFLLAQQIMT
jgi:hypothetical protein